MAAINANVSARSTTVAVGALSPLLTLVQGVGALESETVVVAQFTRLSSPVPGSLLGWDSNGDIIVNIDYVVQYDENGVPLGIIDFNAVEAASESLYDALDGVVNFGADVVDVGSWPEWLGVKAHDFQVTLTVEGPLAIGERRVLQITHTNSLDRVRTAIETAISDLIDATPPGEYANVTSITGSPVRRLATDDDGYGGVYEAP